MSAHMPPCQTEQQQTIERGKATCALMVLSFAKDPNGSNSAVGTSRPLIAAKLIRASRRYRVGQRGDPSHDDPPRA